MSTKRKGGKGGIDIFNFVNRRAIPDSVKDHFSLSLRLYREALLAKEGSIDMWTDLAGMINVGGVRAHELNKPEWIADLNQGADALREISARYDRVGGRVAASEQEAAGISIALDCLEYQVWESMTMDDFIRIGTAIDRSNQHLKELPS